MQHFVPIGGVVDRPSVVCHHPAGTFSNHAAMCCFPSDMICPPLSLTQSGLLHHHFPVSLPVHYRRRELLRLFLLLSTLRRESVKDCPLITPVESLSNNVQPIGVNPPPVGGAHTDTSHVFWPVFCVLDGQKVPGTDRMDGDNVDRLVLSETLEIVGHSYASVVCPLTMS